MSSKSGKKNGAASGWILVTGLLLLCITGTGLTWWNYSRQVFTSTHGVLQLKGPEIQVLVNDLPAEEVRQIRPGHLAKITIGHDKQLLHGAVLSLDPETLALIVRLKEQPAAKTQVTNGTLCAMTIDTTVPPLEGNN